MNKSIRSMTAGWFLACIMTAALTIGQIVSFAASGKISFSDPSVMAGKEVNVKMQIKVSGADELDRSVVMLSYDTGMLEFLGGVNASGGAGSIQVTGSAADGDSKTFVSTLKFKALKPGGTKITVADQEIYDSNGQMVEISQTGSSSVTIAAQASASNDADLSGLRVAPGELTPAFSPDVEQYTVDVGEDVDKVVVNADLSSANAKIVVNGGSGLQMGENTVTCQVTAEDGQTVRTYTILVNKGEIASAAPEESGGEEGVEFHTASKTLTILPLDEGVEAPDGFLETKIKVDGQEVVSWTKDGTGSEEFLLLYARNESGDRGFYWYDQKEKTLQRYHQSSDTAVPQEQYAKEAAARAALQKDYDQAIIYVWILLGTSALLLILLAVVLIALLRRGKTRAEGLVEEPGEEPDPEDKGGAMSEEEQYLRGEEPQEAWEELQEYAEDDEEPQDGDWGDPEEEDLDQEEEPEEPEDEPEEEPEEPEDEPEEPEDEPEEPTDDDDDILFEEWNLDELDVMDGIRKDLAEQVLDETKDQQKDGDDLEIVEL